jgi:hypothetical protein
MDGVAQDEQMRDPCRGTTRGSGDRSSIDRRRGDRGRGISTRELGRDAEGLVLLGGRPPRPRNVAESLATAGGREPPHLFGREAPHSLQDVQDGGRGRAVARLTHRGVPAPRQPLPGPCARRLAKQFVEGVADHDVGELARHRILDGGFAARSRGEALHRGAFRVIERGLQVSRHEPTDGREKGDRGPLRESESVQFVHGQPSDPVHDDRDTLRDRGDAADDRPDGWPFAVQPGTGPEVDGSRHALAVVPAPQFRVAQPVVGDVDPLGEVQCGRPGDIGMVASEQPAPGDLDRLRTGVVRDTEPDVEVIGGEWGAGRHRSTIVVATGPVPRYARVEGRRRAAGLQEGGTVSFMKKAQEAAEAARSKVEEAASAASRTASDPSTTERINKSLTGASQGAREAVGLARRGVTTVVERIDPGTLAELIVKATALQEMTNTALRKKGSPYRISEISISASIPPGVTFAIGRIDDDQETLDGTVHSSAELVDREATAGEVVLALDGATIDEAIANEIAEAAAVPGTLPPSSVTRS